MTSLAFGPDATMPVPATARHAELGHTLPVTLAIICRIAYQSCRIGTSSTPT
jgi:hypothetical protein